MTDVVYMVYIHTRLSSTTQYGGVNSHAKASGPPANPHDFVKSWGKVSLTRARKPWATRDYARR